MDKEFIKELDEFAQANYTEISDKLKDTKIHIIDIKHYVNVPEEFLTKYNLISEYPIEFVLNPPQMLYYYGGLEVKPKCHYIRKKEHHEVSTLRILQECIKQGTNKPDIMYLEDGLREKK